MTKEMLAAWVWRLALMVAMYWAFATFVSKADYKLDLEKAEKRRDEMIASLNTIGQTLIRIDEKMKTDERQDAILKDHENRIRENERIARGIPK